MRRHWIPAGLILANFFLFFALSEGDIDSNTQAKVAAIGKEVAGELMATLKSALARAIREGGAENAIGVCREQAMVLTERTAERYPGVEVRRTTLKYRNPANRPDPIDKVVLNELAGLKRKGEELPDYQIRISETGGDKVYRYYQPIVTSSFCLNCHGDETSIPNKVALLLKAAYPDDKAVGYQENEFRGVIAVHIPREQLP